MRWGRLLFLTFHQPFWIHADKMKTPAFGLTITAILISASSLGAWPIPDNEVNYQNQNFEQWWGTDLVWRFDDLPTDGSVPKHRYPYSGAIYPDNANGTAFVLRKYDRAFHGARSVAESFEYHDIRVHQEQSTVTVRGGLFGRRVFNRTQTMTPHWAGHCNGWAAAAIRHAEPTKNVTRNGVVFTPADIKGLLAELYVYTEIEHLGGVDRAINPGTLHVVLSNWLGHNQHPVAMDSSVGKEVWNYPIYAYRSTNARRGNRRVEVKINLGYVNYTQQEYNIAPKDNYRYLYFHYSLDLDTEGKVTGGTYFGDSNRLDMLWVPLMPTPGGQEGNEPGNPHLDVNEVLAMWRESAPEDRRKDWFTVDAAADDQIVREPLADIVTDAEVSEVATDEPETVAEATVEPVADGETQAVGDGEPQTAADGELETAGDEQPETGRSGDGVAEQEAPEESTVEVGTPSD